MGFSQPKTPTEPTIRRCKFCGHQIRYVAGAKNTKAPGWCHLGFTRGAADWVTCSGKSAPVPIGTKHG